jgi:hypothetical protein
LSDDVTAAFERIERFDVESMTEAFKLLLVSERRVCLIVVLDEAFEPMAESGKLVITREQPISLLISDRVLGDRVQALWGDPDKVSFPGAFALAELALPAVTGQLLVGNNGKDGAICEPVTLSPLFLQDQDRKDLPGRGAVMLELRVTGGTLQARTGPGANL